MSLKTILETEPVLLLNFVKATIALAVVFGLGLPVGADVAILMFVETVITLATRSQVWSKQSVAVDRLLRNG